MKIPYKNRTLETVLICINVFTGIVVTATFILLYGFDKPLGSVVLFHTIQAAALLVFWAEKIIRYFNAQSKSQFFGVHWFEIPLFVLLIATVLTSDYWSNQLESKQIKFFVLNLYLILQLITKICRSAVALAATGRNPTIALIGSFMALIICGCGILMLPRSHNCQEVSFVDSLFTATSATCVTGLTVRDIGRDFSLFGQIVILMLIQFGGLGFLIFGAVFALLLGQALSMRETVAMQDVLSERTAGRISYMIGFIFTSTVIIESIGAVLMLDMWKDIPAGAAGITNDIHHRWFCSYFHAISAFCNAGFGLYTDNLAGFNRCWRIYIIIAPLIILGGIGFSVLYDLCVFAAYRIKKIFTGSRNPNSLLVTYAIAPRMKLQTKIVLATTLILVAGGTAAIFLFETFAPNPANTAQATAAQTLAGSYFQSVSARTAGFNSIDIAAMSQASRLVLIMLMFIGGSPGSTAGGIKTVTFTIIMMVVYTTLRRRPQVELFRRSVPLVIVGRAITITLLYGAVLITVILALNITEHRNNFTLGDIAFESASALGTVGLSTGITPQLTTAGKLIIIMAMFVGRLGPLTLLATVAFSMKPTRFDYPSEPLVVG